MAHPLSQIFFPLVCPPLRNLVIASTLSLWRRCRILWSCLGRRNLGMTHPLGQLFGPLDCPPLRTLGIVSALSLWGVIWLLWFRLVIGYLGVTSPLNLEGCLLDG